MPYVTFVLVRIRQTLLPTMYNRLCICEIT